ncbi:Vi polysaccharide biosynthesis UDP-N-acetylglucosamine C-6 dehydrogenase TviB, partial [Citrobacter portucalensis]
MKLENINIGIVGLGYVGLPLAVEFGKNFETIGFDIKKTRVEELRNNIDTTLECSSDELQLAKQLQFTNNIEDIKKCNVYIVTVPTPIDKFKRPDLSPLINASKTIGSILNKG